MATKNQIAMRPVGRGRWSVALLSCLALVLSPARAQGEAPRLPASPSFSFPHVGWLLSAGQGAFDGQQVELRGGSSLVYTEFDFDDFVVELMYRTVGSGPIQPALRLRSQLQADSRQLSGLQLTLRRHDLAEAASVGAEAVGSVTTIRMCGTNCALNAWQTGRRFSGTTAWCKAFDCIKQTAGLLALAACGDSRSSVVFKEIVITELSHRPLFNGHDLQGWVGAGDQAAKCWDVRDGTLVCTGAAGPWLRSEELFGDFNLRLEYRLKDGGNSGVYVRVPRDGRHHGAGAGIEVQILDDAAPRYAELKPYQFAGSLYAIVAARPGTARPARQWNTLEIDCRGTHYRVAHNGRVVIQTSASEFAELGQRLITGYLGLQNHSETVWFRNIRVRTSS